MVFYMASPPRIGYLFGGKITHPGHSVLHSPLAQPRTAVDVAGGVVLVDDREAVLLRWDDEVVPLATGVHADVQISRDGRTLAARETRGRGPARLQLIDLAGGSRHTVAGPDRDGELRVTGVTGEAVWFRVRDVPAEMRWALGDAAARPADLPPPASGWTGPGAPVHRHYPARDCRRSYTSAWWPPQLIVAEDGERRTYPLPEGARRGSWSGPGPVWEDPDHLLIAVEGDPELGHHVRRLAVASGEWEVAAAGLTVAAFVWPWPARDDFG